MVRAAANCTGFFFDGEEERVFKDTEQHKKNLSPNK